MNNRNQTTNILLLLSHKLRKNIILLGFRTLRWYSHIQCFRQNKKHNNRCLVPYYIFQNYFYSLLQTNNREQIVFCWHHQNLYLVHNSKALTPILSITPVYESIIFNNQNITNVDIFNLLNEKSVNFDFTIVLYSTFEFKQKQTANYLSNNTLCIHKGKNDTILHLLLTPSLNTFEIFISIINLGNIPCTINYKNNISLPHIPEGIKLTSTTINKFKNEEILNEHYCICQFPDTQFIAVDPPHQFSHLAPKKTQKFFLLENLKSLGLLTQSLDQKLRICSEISFLSFDTEALNKVTANIDLSMINPSLFEPSFQADKHQKTIFGVQKLYLIGLVDPIPINSMLSILKQYLPKTFFITLFNYLSFHHSTTSFPGIKTRGCINWKRYKKMLLRTNLEQCSEKILTQLSNIQINSSNVKTFHIANNDNVETSIEPNASNISTMIHHFIYYLYRRNVLASLLKFIILKPTLQKFEKFIQFCGKKSTFYNLYKRMQEIVFESILISFNGSNYDNFLICNDIIILLSKINQKVKIFKKGASLSTIILNIKSIVLAPDSSYSKYQKINGKWPMNLYIKDIRNLLSPNMTLDRIGKLFNLEVSKLCFPYDQATSIAKLKTLHSLDPYNELFWKDTFQGKSIPLDTRLNAQLIFSKYNFSNLYEYGTHYLHQDCLLLHAILQTLFQSYLKNSINIFLRRVYSQSHLAYQQFFIIEPAQQIFKTLAPKVINNPLYNYIIKQSVTGGLCTSFVHGALGKNTLTTINEHFQYLDSPNLNPKNWPNFHNITNCWKSEFTNKASGISTFDIRSLYPSASVKKLPVGTPLFYTRIPKESIPSYKSFLVNKDKHFALNEYCKLIRNRENNSSTDFFVRLNQYPRGKHEFNAISNYLQQIQSDPEITILLFQSNFTALGQFYWGKYPVDGFLCYTNCKGQFFIKIIQYNSVYFHGHRASCDHTTSICEKKQNETQKIKHQILQIWHHFSSIFNLQNNVHFEYIEISDCDFTKHIIPKITSYLNYRSKYDYNSFLNQIRNKQIHGFLVLKNLEIKKDNQNPIFGFLVQKSEYGIEQLSKYTQDHVQTVKSARRVIAMHKTNGFMVINTEYFVWLWNTFGFQQTPDIYHALCFQLDDYARISIEQKLNERSQLKLLIAQEQDSEKKQMLEVRAELIKLMLNSSYGYTLCNLTSSKFKQFVNKTKIPRKQELSKFTSGIKLTENCYIFEVCHNHHTNFQTLLGHVGSYILFQSKIILLKRLYFLLKYLNPSKAQLLYMDTDSAHFLLLHPNLAENVDYNLRNEFLTLLDKHFNSGPKISGIWVHENFFENAEYLGEKSYFLYNNSNDDFITHMKGLNTTFQRQFIQNKIDPLKVPVISYNIFYKSSDFSLFKTNLCKSIFINFAPIKRYFISNTGSLPLKL